MNAERLHAIAIAIRDDFRAEGTLIALGEVESNLQNMVNQPNQTQYQQQLTDARSKLRKSLEASVVNSFGSTWQQALDEMSGSIFTGRGLLFAVEDIFDRNQMTPAVALSELNKLVKDVYNFAESIDSVDDAMYNLNIRAEELEPGECEIGILIPRSFVSNKLDPFGRELTELNKILGVFSELVTGERPGFNIRTISSSDLSVFLEAAAPVCASIAIAIERIVELYKKLLEIKKLRSDLDRLGLDKSVTSGVANHAEKIISEGIDELAKELEEKYLNGRNDGRQNELSIELRHSLKKIAGRIDRGFNIDVRMSAPEDAKAPDEASDPLSDTASYQTIVGAADNLKYMNKGGEPILGLPDSGNSEAK